MPCSRIPSILEMEYEEREIIADQLESADNFEVKDHNGASSGRA